MVSRLGDVAPDSEDFVPADFELLELVGFQNGLFEQAHDVVGNHYEIEGCLCSSKVLHVEITKAKIGLDLFDPVLAIGPSPVHVPDHFGRQAQVGDIATVPIIFKDAFFFEELELLAGGFGSPVDLLADHYQPAGRFPSVALVGGLGNLKSIVKQPPVFEAGNLPLDPCRNGGPQ